MSLHTLTEKGDIIMELKLGDVQTTALIPLAIKANEGIALR